MSGLIKKSTVSGAQETLATNLECGTFCDSCRQCANEVMDAMKAAKKNETGGGSQIGANAKTREQVASKFKDVVTIGMRRKQDIIKSRPEAGGDNSIQSIDVKEEKITDKKVSAKGKEAEKEKKEEGKDQKTEKAVVFREEILTKKETEQISKIRMDINPETVRSAQSQQQNNLAEMLRYQQMMLARQQQEINRNAMPDNSTAARLRANESANGLMQQNAQQQAIKSHTEVVQQLAIQQAAQKAMSLINKTIDEVTNIRNGFSEKRGIQLNGNIPDAAAGRSQDKKMIQIEKSMEVLAQYIYLKNKQKVPAPVKDALQSMKIINSVKQGTKTSAVHREVAKETIKEVRKALKVIKAAATVQQTAQSKYIGPRQQPKIAQARLRAGSERPAGVRRRIKPVRQMEVRAARPPTAESRIMSAKKPGQSARQEIAKRIVSSQNGLHTAAKRGMKSETAGLASSPMLTRFGQRLERATSTKLSAGRETANTTDRKVTVRSAKVTSPDQSTRTLRTLSKKPVTNREVARTVRLQSQELKDNKEKKTVAQNVKELAKSVIKKIVPAKVAEVAAKVTAKIKEFISHNKSAQVFTNTAKSALNFIKAVLPQKIIKKAVLLSKAAKNKLLKVKAALEAIKKLFNLAFLEMLQKQQEREKEEKLKLEALKKKQSSKDKKPGNKSKNNGKDLDQDDELEEMLLITGHNQQLQENYAMDTEDSEIQPYLV